MIRIATAIFACALLSACGATHYSHPTKPEAQLEADFYDCRTIAAQYTQSIGFGGNPFIMNDEIDKCLQQKHGWRPDRYR